MSDRIELVCPECGAPLSPAAATSAVKCTQCGTTSQPAPKAPEKVVQTVIVERVVVREGAAGPATTPCPRCQVALFAVRANYVTVQGCGVCGGIWLDNAGTIAITKTVDPQIAVLASRAEKNAALRVSPGGQRLDCPICGKQMQRVNASHLAELDVCPAHGTWFDPGELRRVMSAIHTKDDDPLAPIAGKRDAVEERLAHLAERTTPPPPPWAFEGPTTAKILDGGLAILGGIVAASAAVAVAGANAKAKLEP